MGCGITYRLHERTANMPHCGADASAESARVALPPKAPVTPTIFGGHATTLNSISRWVGEISCVREYFKTGHLALTQCRELCRPPVASRGRNCIEGGIRVERSLFPSIPRRDGERGYRFQAAQSTLRPSARQMRNRRLRQLDQPKSEHVPALLMIAKFEPCITKLGTQRRR